ncbi:MAG: hypothetical protein V1882_04605 [Candidatus Omnitrophota bacterium]
MVLSERDDTICSDEFEFYGRQAFDTGILSRDGISVSRLSHLTVTTHIINGATCRSLKQKKLFQIFFKNFRLIFNFAVSEWDSNKEIFEVKRLFEFFLEFF